MTALITVAISLSRSPKIPVNPSNDGTCARHWIPAHGKQVGHNRQQCQHHLWWMVIRVLTVTMEMVTSVWRDQKSDSDRFREFFRYQIFSNGLRTFFQYRFRDFFQYQIFFETDSEVIFGTEFFAVPNFFGTGSETFLVPIFFLRLVPRLFWYQIFPIPPNKMTNSRDRDVTLWWWQCWIMMMRSCHPREEPNTSDHNQADFLGEPVLKISTADEKSKEYGDTKCHSSLF